MKAKNKKKVKVILETYDGWRKEYESRNLSHRIIDFCRDVPCLFLYTDRRIGGKPVYVECQHGIRIHLKSF